MASSESLNERFYASRWKYAGVAIVFGLGAFALFTPPSPREEVVLFSILWTPFGRLLGLVLGAICLAFSVFGLAVAGGAAFGTPILEISSSVLKYRGMFRRQFHRSEVVRLIDDRSTIVIQSKSGQRIRVPIDLLANPRGARTALLRFAGASKPM
jgi:hypothetical protein